jgi:hypothetical protein
MLLARLGQTPPKERCRLNIQVNQFCHEVSGTEWLMPLKEEIHVEEKASVSNRLWSAGPHDWYYRIWGYQSVPDDGLRSDTSTCPLSADDVRLRQINNRACSGIKYI